MSFGEVVSSREGVGEGPPAKIEQHGFDGHFPPYFSVGSLG